MGQRAIMRLKNRIFKILISCLCVPFYSYSALAEQRLVQQKEYLDTDGQTVQVYWTTEARSKKARALLVNKGNRSLWQLDRDGDQLPEFKRLDTPDYTGEWSWPSGSAFLRFQLKYRDTTHENTLTYLLDRELNRYDLVAVNQRQLGSHYQAQMINSFGTLKTMGGLDSKPATCSLHQKSPDTDFINAFPKFVKNLEEAAKVRTEILDKINKNELIEPNCEPYSEDIAKSLATTLEAPKEDPKFYVCLAEKTRNLEPEQDGEFDLLQQFSQLSKNERYRLKCAKNLPNDTKALYSDDGWIKLNISHFADSANRKNLTHTIFHESLHASGRYNETQVEMLADCCGSPDNQLRTAACGLFEKVSKGDIDIRLREDTKIYRWLSKVYTDEKRLNELNASLIKALDADQCNGPIKDCTEKQNWLKALQDECAKDLENNKVDDRFCNDLRVEKRTFFVGTSSTRDRKETSRDLASKPGTANRGTMTVTPIDGSTAFTAEAKSQIRREMDASDLSRFAAYTKDTMRSFLSPVSVAYAGEKRLGGSGFASKQQARNNRVSPADSRNSVNLPVTAQMASMASMSIDPNTGRLSFDEPEGGTGIASAPVQGLGLRKPASAVATKASGSKPASATGKASSARRASSGGGATVASSASSSSSQTKKRASTVAAATAAKPERDPAADPNTPGTAAENDLPGLEGDPQGTRTIASANSSTKQKLKSQSDVIQFLRKDPKVISQDWFVKELVRMNVRVKSAQGDVGSRQKDATVLSLDEFLSSARGSRK